MSGVERHASCLVLTRVRVGVGGWPLLLQPPALLPYRLLGGISSMLSASDISLSDMSGVPQSLRPHINKLRHWVCQLLLPKLLLCANL